MKTFPRETIEEALDSCWYAKAGDDIAMSSLEKLAMATGTGGWDPRDTPHVLQGIQRALRWLEDTQAYATYSAIEHPDTARWATGRVAHLSRAQELLTLAMDRLSDGRQVRPIARLVSLDGRAVA